MKESKIPAEWFARFMTHCVNNINNREGLTRFSYLQLRTSLTIIEHGSDDIDPEISKLLSNIIGALPPIDLSERQITTLCLAMMNAHMAYHLINPDLLKFARGEENDD